jgi:hypothetical protein
MTFLFNDNIQKVKLLNHIYSIFLIALFLVIFEILLFYLIIIPQLKKNILSGIQNITNILKEKNIIFSINNIVDDLLNKILDNNLYIFDENKINTYKNEIKQEIKDTIREELKNMKKNNIIENFDKNKKRRFHTDISDELLNKIIKILNKYNVQVDEQLFNNLKLIINTNFDEKLYNILSTLEENEKHLIDLNNNNLLILCIIVVSVIILCLYLISHLVKSNNNHKGINTCTYIYTSFIIIFIILFQVNFYFFTQNYKYIGNLGDQEILFYLLN